MHSMKGLVLASILVLPVATITCAPLSAAETKTETTAAKKPTKDQLSAYEERCSKEADAKGLTRVKGKSEERKTFRVSCIKKLISE